MTDWTPVSPGGPSWVPESVESADTSAAQSAAAAAQSAADAAAHDASAAAHDASAASYAASAGDVVTTHAALTETHGVTGDIVGTTDVQTLSNKTLDSPILVTPSMSGATLFGRGPVASISNVPDALPTIGMRRLVGTAPSGVWTAYANQVAEYFTDGWHFSDAPTDGQLVFVQDMKRAYRFISGAWRVQRSRLVYDDDPSFATLADADAFAVAAGAELVIRNDFTLTTNTTLNAKVVVFRGATCTLGAYNLTFANEFRANGYQCFVCTGSGDPSVGAFAISGRPIFSGGGVTLDPRWFGVVTDNNPASDNGPSYNLTFAVAAHDFASVVIPRGTSYIATTIQACIYVAAGQSAGPDTVYGSGYSSCIKAKTGMTGEMIFAKNISGAKFCDFMIDGNNNAWLKWLNTDWWAVGPTQLNEYARLLFQNLALGTVYNSGAPGVGHSARNNNQSIWRNVVYRAAYNGDNTGVGLDMEGSGGSYYVYDTIVDCGTTRLTCQNATFIGGYYAGFEYCVAQTGNPCIGYTAAQVYSNSRTKACFSSGSPGTPGHAVYSLCFRDCQFPLTDNSHVFFDLMLACEIRSINSMYVAATAAGTPTALNMFGPNMIGPPDTIWNAKVIFQGGGVDYPAQLVTNSAPTNIAVGKRDFFNFNTNENYTAPDITVIYTGAHTSGTGIPVVTAAGSLPRGSYKATINYDHVTDGAPYEVQGVVDFVMLPVNFSGADQVMGGNWASHTSSGASYAFGLKSNTSYLTPAIEIVPNFTNAGTHQTVRVDISRIH